MITRSLLLSPSKQSKILLNLALESFSNTMIEGLGKIDRRYLDLIIYKVFTDLRAEAAKTYVNYLWWVLDPILSMLVFYVVFGLLLKKGGSDFVAFLLIGLTTWNWYTQTLSHAGNSIIGGKGLMNQVYIPKLVFPLVNLLTDLTKFIVVLFVLLIFLWLTGYGVTVAYLALPAVLGTQLLLIMALSLIVALIVPWVPDFKLVISHLLNLQFFMSGIFFDISSLPMPYANWILFNPMACLIMDYRAILMVGEWPHWLRLGLIALLSLMLLLSLKPLLRRWDRLYPRIVQ